MSVRQTWRADRELFVSYVRSSSFGDVNDYGTLVTNLDVPLFEPAGRAPMPTDTPHRLRGWATFQFPHEIVVSPAVEWRTGFPYSIVDIYRHYVGDANSERFPNYFSLDITTFKTFDIFGRSGISGLQFFNVTGHFNPRDVIAVVEARRASASSRNSFGDHARRLHARAVVVVDHISRNAARLLRDSVRRHRRKPMARAPETRAQTSGRSAST